jgi:K+-sensing histidine kinase KdpD
MVPSRTQHEHDPGGRAGRPDPSVSARGPGRSDGVRFLEILAHELRTPVTTIYGGAQLLARNGASTDPTRGLAEDIRSEADRLYRLIEDLVLLTQSERDGLHPSDEPVAVSRLVRSAVWRESARRPELDIKMRGEQDAVVDRADELFVTHVIRNLLDNAIRNDGGTGPIEVVVGSGREVTVRFLDGGPLPHRGIDSFDYRVDPPTTTAGRAGAGISLHVTDRLIASMGGRVWAGGSLGRAEFGFALPTTTDEPARRIS